MKWKQMKLVDCCKSISDGDHQAPPRADNGIPFVTIANITEENQFDFKQTMFVPQVYYDNLDSKRKPEVGDILYSVVGSFGIPVLVKNFKKFVFQRHIAILKPEDNIYSKFLYYTMLSRDFYMQADSVAIGAAQRTISLTALKNMTLNVPDIDNQHRMADVLYAYDDLIENNQKQIKLLEEAAQRLYKEWFVDLRFPGWENAKIVDGVPEGWKNTTIGEICKVRKEIIEACKIPNGLPYIGLEHMPRKDFCLAAWGISDSVTSNKFMYYDNDIIFGKIRPYFHKVGFALNSGVVSTDAIVLVAKKQLWGLLLSIVSSDAFVDYSYQNCKEGAKMPRADWNQMSHFHILLASEAIQKKYECNISRIVQKIKKLALQNRLLRESRDRLLPKLMSGELEV